MLCDFENQAVAVIVGFERVEDFRQIAVEFHIDDGADDLRDVARARVGCGVVMPCPLGPLDRLNA